MGLWGSVKVDPGSGVRQDHPQQQGLLRPGPGRDQAPALPGTSLLRQVVGKAALFSYAPDGSAEQWLVFRTSFRSIGHRMRLAFNNVV